MRTDLLFEDYKLKLDYLTAQYDRLWQRFNFFLTVELALFGFLSYLTFDKNVPNPSLLPAVCGLGVSALWYVVGAQDRYLVEEYRRRAAAAAAAFAQEPDTLPGYGAEHPARRVHTHWYRPWSWYCSAVSITHLPVIVATGSFAIWVVVLIYWSALTRCLRC